MKGWTLSPFFLKAPISPVAMVVLPPSPYSPATTIRGMFIAFFSDNRFWDGFMVWGTLNQFAKASYKLFVCGQSVGLA